MTERVPLSVEVCGAAGTPPQWLMASLRAPWRQPGTQAKPQDARDLRPHWGLTSGSAILLLTLKLNPLLAIFAREPGTPNPILSGVFASVGTGFWPLVLAAYMVGILVPLLRGAGRSRMMAQVRTNLPQPRVRLPGGELIRAGQPSPIAPRGGRPPAWSAVPSRRLHRAFAPHPSACRDWSG